MLTDLPLTAEERLELAELKTQLEALWPDGVALHGLVDELVPPEDRIARSFYAELARLGLSVPGWPSEHGGRDWSRVMTWAFELLLADLGAPPLPFAATHLIGPWLMRHGSEAQRRRWLPDMRDLRIRWSMAETDALDDPANLTRSGTEYRVTGEKIWVAGGTAADVLLCRFAMGESLIVPLPHDGVAVRPVPMLGEASAIASVRFVDARFSAEDHLTIPVAVLEEARHAAPGFARSARLKRNLAALSQVIERLGVDLQADDDFQHRTRESAHGIALLEALEMRAGLAWVSGVPEPALTDLAALRGAEVGQELSALVSDALGYYALPSPPELTLHNEGVIGDEIALPAIRRLQFDRAWSMRVSAGSTDSADQVKNRLARQVLGLPAAE